MNIFSKFYNANKERIFSYLLRKSGDYHLAADIMQDSFIRYFERYRDREQSIALLFTIARNLFYDHARKNHFHLQYDEMLHGSDTDQERLYEVREELRVVLSALQQMDEEERDLLSLVVSSGLSYRKIAEITGNSEANIKVKVHRSRVKLKKILQQGRV